MIGAACLAAETALRSGAGLVKLLVPETVAGLCATKLTEVMVFGLPDTGDGAFAGEAADAAAPFLEEADAVLLGPGISTTPPTREFVRRMLDRITQPLVLDADALNSLAASEEPPPACLREVPAILTPHPGELARLLRTDVAELQADRVHSAIRAAEYYGCEVIFKGAPSVIASPDGDGDLCSLGNDGMATAGSGDVLAGLLAGLLAQGCDAPDAARLGAMVHGRAGDVCRLELGRRGMIAGDIVRCLPYVWRELEFEGMDESAPEKPESNSPTEEDVEE
jgi:NAD(P)H-hydrate epimerase